MLEKEAQSGSMLIIDEGIVVLDMVIPPYFSLLRQSVTHH